MLWADGGEMAPSSLEATPMERPMPQQLNDLSRSLTALDQASTIIAVIEMSQASWLVAGIVPGIERHPLKKLEPDEDALLRLLHRWRDEAAKAGCAITRLAVAFEAGRDGFWLARWLEARGVEPVGLGPAMFPRYRDTRGMDHVSLDVTRLKPARQPEAVAAGFEGKRNPRDRAAGPDRLIPPAMQHCNQPFWARLELLARLTLNPGKHAGDEPARLAHLDDGYDRAILVQGDEGSAQVVRLGHRGTPSVKCSDEVAISSPPAP